MQMHINVSQRVIVKWLGCSISCVCMLQTGLARSDTDAAGDPVRLFHHLGLGVWAFLAQPAAGLVDTARGAGPLRLLSGLADGCQDLLGNTLFAFSNATAKASTALRKVRWAIDEGICIKCHPGCFRSCIRAEHVN